MCVGGEEIKQQKNGCNDDTKGKICSNKMRSAAFFLRMTWRWTAGTKPDYFCQLCISIASQHAIVKVRENGWTPPLITGTLVGIRANTRTWTVISPFLSAPLSPTVYYFLVSFFFTYSLSWFTLVTPTLITHHHHLQVYMDDECAVCLSLHHVRAWESAPVCVNVWGCQGS